MSANRCHVRRIIFVKTSVKSNSMATVSDDFVVVTLQDVRTKYNTNEKAFSMFLNCF